MYKYYSKYVYFSGRSRLNTIKRFSCCDCRLYFSYDLCALVLYNIDILKRGRTNKRCKDIEKRLLVNS